MSALRDKTILILSPQAWGTMFLSKHHYAVALARRGNKVFFLNPPRQASPGQAPSRRTPGTPEVVIIPSGIDDNLRLIDHSLKFPYDLKFHLRPLFHFFMRGHVKKILRAIGRPVDIVWSFDLGNLYPFSLFPGSALKIFHPVDEPLNPTAIRSGQGASVIFSVTREILGKYAHLECPAHLINHGLADPFLIPVDIQRSPSGPPRVGMSGNLLRGDIDREIFLNIVTGNPDIRFECWGSYAVEQSNIAGSNDEATRQFIAGLRAMPNVVLHGAVPTEKLASAIHCMDAFLICYDINKDQSGGTNYHKIMEYLSTGKAIVSNNVSAFSHRDDLIQMVKERGDNHRLPDLFKQVTRDLPRFNNPALQEARIAFSRENTYSAQLDRIENLVTPLNPNLPL